MELRPLGSTGIMVSPLGIGTVKFGRNQQVKYPYPFNIPEDKAVRNLLAITANLNINLIDTAPAYGNSEIRLGRLLPGPRDRWVIASKVGEFFEQGRSYFDFSANTTRLSVENSLRRLRTDYLDLVLIHSDGNDLHILNEEGALESLRQLKQEGLIRAYGMSSKTVEGGVRVVEMCDLVMATCSLEYDEELPVLQAAERLKKGVLIKKGLQSGHICSKEWVRRSMSFIFTQPGVSSIIIGTINPEHLRQNVAIVNELFEQ